MPGSGPKRPPSIAQAVAAAFREDPRRRKLVERAEREAAEVRAKARITRQPRDKR